MRSSFLVRLLELLAAPPNGFSHGSQTWKGRPKSSWPPFAGGELPPFPRLWVAEWRLRPATGHGVVPLSQGAELALRLSPLHVGSWELDLLTFTWKDTVAYMVRV